MENESTYKLIAIGLGIALFLLNFHTQSLAEQMEILEDDLDEAKSNLEEANDNIEEANANIENAQGYAWSSYTEMGYALDDLQTVNTVD